MNLQSNSFSFLIQVYALDLTDLEEFVLRTTKTSTNEKNKVTGYEDTKMSNIIEKNGILMASITQWSC